MTNQFVALPSTATVQDAIDALRGLDEDFESIYYVYTTDAEGALTGVLSMRSLVVAEHTDRLKDLAYRDVVPFATRTAISWASSRSTTPSTLLPRSTPRTCRSPVSR